MAIFYTYKHGIDIKENSPVGKIQGYIFILYFRSKVFSTLPCLPPPLPQQWNTTYAL